MAVARIVPIMEDRPNDMEELVSEYLIITALPDGEVRAEQLRDWRLRAKRQSYRIILTLVACADLMDP